MRRILTLLLLCLCTCLSIEAQDPVYSQYYNAPLQLNPAFAGNSIAPIVAINYRNEYPVWPNAYTTYSVSYDQFFEQYNSGLGIFLLSDNAGEGILKTNKISAVYAYKILINKDLQMKFGIETSFTQMRLDWDKLEFFDQLDIGNVTGGGSMLPTTEIRPNSLNSNIFDLSFGLLLYSRSYYGGLTMKHLNTPDNNFLDNNSQLSNGLPVRFSIHAGNQINLNSSNNYNTQAFISPNILYVKQSELQQLNVGTFFGLGPFLGGLWYRHAFGNPDAAIISAGMRSGIFRITYSFDFTLSDLGIGNTGGSHELGIILNFESLYPKPTKYNDCFSIFR